MSLGDELFDIDVRYQHQLGVVAQRWPEVYQAISTINDLSDEVLVTHGAESTLFVSGIHLSSSYDRKAEAALQARGIPETADLAWVYGVGTGDLINHLLQHRHLSQLNVVVMNKQIFKAGLRFFNFSHWIEDQRVKLLLADSQHDLSFPFAVTPSYLRLADKEVARLRDMLAVELATEYINARVIDNPIFKQQVVNNYDVVAQDGDVSALFNTLSEGEVYVAAAGPSLKSAFPILKMIKSNDLLIAVDAALRPLLSNNIIPDIVISLDGHRDNLLRYYDVDMSLLSDAIMVYFPVVNRDVIDRWHAQRLVAYTRSILFEDISKKYPKGYLHSSGTVLHPAVDLAVKMGGKKIYLCGADLSFPDKKQYADGVDDGGRVLSVNQEHSVVNGYGENVVTQLNFIGYLRDLERYIAHHKDVLFVNMSRSGACIHGATYYDEL